MRIELLEEIYNELYAYRLQHDSEEDWPHRILNYREVQGMRDVEVDGKPAVELQVQNNTSLYSAHNHKQQSSTETLTVDLVVVASGYVRNAYEDMLKGVRELMPGGDATGKNWTVARNYAVDFERGAVASDAGVWLQGCNEKTHGLSDTLLSILAIRGGEMVDSIFGYSMESQQKKVVSSFEQLR